MTSIFNELREIYDILASFLGEAKNGFCDDCMQLQFPCPRCVERDGQQEVQKYNLEVNLQKQMFLCWKCSSMDTTEIPMHGSIIKLIKMYGTPNLLYDYKKAIQSLRESDLYRIHYQSTDFNISDSIENIESLVIPYSAKDFSENGNNNKTALDYLEKRNIKWDIINEYNLGYTETDNENYKYSNRIIIPSYDSFGELNYWTGRDYTLDNKRQKYYNPKVDRKNIIFNEGKIQWDADITLVEGPFDHLVVPNSVPLLGKSIDSEYRLYEALFERSQAHVNIFLDGDAIETVYKIYKTLNHDRLYNRIRYVPVPKELDPSEIYQKYGKKGIIKSLQKVKYIK